ncbi:MAG: hypothetical protein AVDCRST_MAG77-3913 [uncultured Chloroflexi bacterium]|uniref:Uncharacterized protein n=1 Tax=uncultured Chloroflexota bacterium TaxID=166587 RepID=A0A6J4JLV4_9CHLR|nr:MAG: hypothetical protein AVDCRST_MAG77-3913 [uncultured Chloroflexota bacterium]
MTESVAPGAVEGAAGVVDSQSPWRRIERRDDRGEVTDWVEVAQCVLCGRGVDRAFPVEYNTDGDEVVCRGCSPR